MGHFVRECPIKVVVGGIVCQGCGIAGKALKACPQANCLPLVAMLGNGGCRNAAKPPAFCVALIETQEFNGIIGIELIGMESSPGQVGIGIESACYHAKRVEKSLG